MPESIARIHALLDRLARRERRILGWEAAALALAVWLAGWGALVVAVNLNQVGAGSRSLWIVGLLTSGVVAGGLRLRDWRSARDRRRQALRIEAHAPDLRGSLLTLVDRTGRPVGSPTLLERIALTVDPIARGIPAPQVHPAGRARIATLGAALLAALLVTSGVLLPAGPVQALAALWPGASPQSVAAVPASEDGPRALIGDITLRYHYPTYTRLEPMDVPNSSGDVHAPPGTRVEVRARTAVAYPAAEIEVYASPPEPVTITDTRSLAASFVVEGMGTWRFRFGELPSPDYQITPDADLPPDVAIQSPHRSLAVSVDGPILFGWTARDDYGLGRVVIEVREGGRTREVVLRQPADTPRALGEQARTTPAELGLSPGAHATLRVGAWDNDAISGSKPGFSAPIDLDVLGARGSGERRNFYRERLRDVLLVCLAEFLVEPSAPFARGNEAGPWALNAHARYDAFDAVLHEASAGVAPSGADATAIGAVQDKRAALIGFARGVSSAAGPLDDRDRATLVTLHSATIDALEGAILVFDRILRSAAESKVAQLAEEVSAEAQELKEDLAGLSRDQALARLDQLGRLLQQLLQQAAKLGEGELAEFLNQRGEEMTSLVDEIRKALAEGRTEDAQELMERLAEQMGELASDMEEMEARKRESSGELAAAMDTLKEQLAGLEARQEALNKATQKAREQHGEAMEDATNAWEEVERRARGVAIAMKAVSDRPEVADLPGSVRMDITATMDDADGLLDSARARDTESAVRRARRLQEVLEGAGFGLGVTERRQPGTPNATLAGEIGRTVRTQHGEVRRILELLEQMQAQQAGGGSPEMQRALQQLAAQQQAIETEAAQAADRAGKLAPSLPMNAPGLEEGTQRARDQAGRAGEAMEAGDPMGSIGGGQAALDGFQQASESLEQARENLESMERSSRGDGGAEPSAGDRQDGDGAGEMEALRLPAPEEFETPEAYREALLEGMSGEVPEEYESINRRYYEELVRQ